MKSENLVKKVFWLSMTFLFMSLSSADAANYTLAVNAGTKGAEWNRFYEKCIASCHAYTVLHSAYGRNISNALKKAHAEAGFQYLRCHGILDNDVAPFKSAGVYDWTNLDAIYDSVVAAGMRPEVELSFMPPALASASSSLTLWYNGVQPSNKPPSNWTTWGNFITALVQHIESRYGAAEVRNNWYFEIWNEPDWMYSGLTDYLTLYDNTVKAIGAADPLIKVGGPAQSGPSSLGSIATLVSHCKSSGSKLDFVSWHRYANDGGYSGTLANSNSISDFAKAVVDQIKTSGFNGLSI
jgi:xylan 1,4-beta-xylosidase